MHAAGARREVTSPCVIRALFRGIRSLIRKLLKLGAVVGAVLFLVRLFTRRTPAHDTETGPAEAKPSGSTASVASVSTASTPRSSASPGSSGSSAATKAAAPTASTEAAVDTAATESAAWVAPQDGGACPASHPVKVKVSSGIYHVPGGTAYDRTTPDRCYIDAAAAEADGYRPSKR